jgi:hypothetical protein
MEKILDLIFEANKAFNMADHLANISYPLLRDNKLLLAITQNLFISGLKGVSAILYYEKLNKKIEVLPFDFDSRIVIFESETARRFNIRLDIIQTIKNLKQILDHHKESPMEFSRNNKLIICNDDYSHIKSIDIEMLKIYIVVMRNFMLTLDGLRQNVRNSS